MSECLGVSASQVRQRLAARTLVGVHGADGWSLPWFQFDHAGHPWSGLEQVLPVLPADLHPVVVAAFLERAHVDLALENEPVAISWLASGGDLAPVVRLARELVDVP